MTDDTQKLLTLWDWKRLTGGTWTWLASQIPCAKTYPGMVAKGAAHPSYEMAKRFEQATGGMVSRENWYPRDDITIGQENDDIIDEALE